MSDPCQVTMREREGAYRTRPRLGVRGELKRVLERAYQTKALERKLSATYVADLEEQTLEVAKLLRRETQQSDVVIEDSTRKLLVSSERI